LRTLVAFVALAAALGSTGCVVATLSSVGAGYTAKVACSLAWNSGENVDDLLHGYIQPEAAPLGSLLGVRKTPDGAEGRAFGGLVRARAIHRPGLGCTLLRDATAESLAQPDGVDAAREPLPAGAPWPRGAAAPTDPAPAAISAAIDRAFAEPVPANGRVRHTTAIVVAHDGRLVADRYASGYGPETPMLSWSMAKSVTAALVGIEIGDGRLVLQAPAPVPEWSSPDDPRRAITLDQLMRMSSGLEFGESFGPVDDLPRMLFQYGDVGAYAAAKKLAAPPDTVWSYSSGTANIVARILRELHGNDLGALVRFSRERLFDAAGMSSAFFEPDASGTFIGSSFAFMTARDWARFGELHRQDGVWFGRRILPEGWVRYVTTPTPLAPDGRYGAHFWLNAGDPSDPSRRPWPKLPTDTYAAAGHSGQYVFVVPSAKLVVVRLGLSLPDDGKEGAEDLVADVIAAIEGQTAFARAASGSVSPPGFAGP
jgi:CubicO group peptidase (beta-lactamase class C family)